MVRQRYQLLPSRDIDDQRILQSVWPQGKTGQTPTRVVVVHATFPL